MKGKMEAAQVDDVARTLMATTKSYPATGEAGSFVFYMRFNVSIKTQKGKTFTGNAGGLASLGVGEFFGDVYTDDLDRLYRETRSFEFQGMPVYMSLLFFDKRSKLLGHFQSGAVSFV